MSGFYLADEIKMNHRGMMRTIPKDEWIEYQEMPPQDLAKLLVEWAGAVPLADERRARGPKKPKPEKQSGAKIKRVATSKILGDRKLFT